jgi:hypothetical protein
MIGPTRFNPMRFESSGVWPTMAKDDWVPPNG